MPVICRDENGKVTEPCTHCEFLGVQTVNGNEPGTFEIKHECLLFPTEPCKYKKERTSSRPKMESFIFEAISEHIHLLDDAIVDYKKGNDTERNLGKMLAYSESLKYFVESLKWINAKE